MKAARITDDLCVGAGCPLVLVAGPCLIEEDGFMIGMARELAAVCERQGARLVFKSSFDKANRSSVDSPRGPGLERGLAALRRLKEELGIPLTTDIHEPWQAEAAADVVDILQIPAFLCRQTDLLRAAAATGRAVNVKKGQFLSPAEMGNVVRKLESAGARAILLTERGTTFGYNNLVVDFRSLPQLRDLGYPVVFDATHSVQLPGGLGTSSGGQRQYVRHLARAAAAVGVDALFVEVHDDPDRAPSDGPNMLTPAALEELLSEVLAIRSAAERAPAGRPS